MAGALIWSLCCSATKSSLQLKHQSPFFTHPSVLQEGTVELLVSGQDGSVVRFKMRNNTPLSKCMLAYAKIQSMQADDFDFTYDGVRGPSNQSCQDLDIQTGDSLHAMPHQVGD